MLSQTNSGSCIHHEPSQKQPRVALNTLHHCLTLSVKQNANMASQSQADLESRVNTLLGRTAWTNGWSSAASLSPPIVRASLSLASVPASKQYLDAKTRALVAIAVDSASTHLYVPGIQRHVRTALEAGATPAEVMEAIELTSTLGIHACNIGVPLLVEVMREEGGYEKYLGNKDGEGGEEVFDERREKLKKEFTEKRGYWHGFWEDFLRLDPEFFEAYLEFSTVPWTKGGKEGEEGRGVLEPKVSSILSNPFPLQNWRLGSSLGQYVCIVLASILQIWIAQIRLAAIFADGVGYRSRSSCTAPSTPLQRTCTSQA